MVSTAEVVVIGGGIVGASTAHYLAEKGVKGVVLLEREGIASGATGRSGALVRMHYTNPWDTALALRSWEVFSRWEELIGGDSGFRRTGFLYLVGPGDRERLVRNVEMQRGVGANTSVVSVEEVRLLQPFMRVDDLALAAYEPDSGHADGYSAATSMARRARELGVQVRQGVRALRILRRGDRVTGVETTEGVVEAPVVVLAAGAWSAPLARTAGVEVPVTPRRLTAGALEAPAELAGRLMACIDQVLGLYFRPDVGNLVHMGIWQGDPPEVDPDNYDATVAERWFVEASRRFSRRIPAMAEAGWRRTWTGVDGFTPDGHMILGQAPGVEGLYLAVGMSGTGFKTGPAVGLCMAELITQGRAQTVDITPFRPTRFEEGQPIAGPDDYRMPPYAE